MKAREVAGQRVGGAFQKVACAKAARGAGRWGGIADLQLHLTEDRDPDTLHLTLSLNTRSYS